jgi:hypothetical protein
MSKRLILLAFVTIFAMMATQAFATKNVTFQVHMGIQEALNAFTVGKNVVVIRGDFEHFDGASQDWWGNQYFMAKSAANDSIFVLTVPLPDAASGNTIQFKYVIIDTSAGQASLKDSSTQGGIWESTGNRTYAVTADANQSLALVYFNDKSTLGLVATHFITFQADMTDLIAAGFNPSTDSIEVRGDTFPLDWGPGKRMTKSLLNPYLYQYKGSFTADVGATIQFKFHADPQAKYDNTGYETGSNQMYTFADKDTVFPPRMPAITILFAITKDVTVTFRVNMTGAKEIYHNTAITNLKGVYIAGSWTPLRWPSAWSPADTASGGPLAKMYDDGQSAHGDLVAGDNIWSIILTFKQADNVPRNIEYKYGAVFTGVDTLNAGVSPLDNEAGYAVNHTLSLDDVTGTQTANATFGVMGATSVREDPAAGLPETYALSQNYPNPFNPLTNIQYSIPKSGFVTLKIYNLLGQEVATLVEGNQTAGTYVATFDASRVSSGVYFYRLSSGRFVEVKKMLLLK